MILKRHARTIKKGWSYQGKLIWSDPETLAPNQVDVSAPSWYEALYSPMIVAVGLLGPIPRSDNPSQVA